MLAGAIVFLLWDRIVDGPFPHKSKGMRYFAQRQSALDTFIERLNADDRVDRLICYEDEVWIDESDEGPRVQLAGTRLDEYLTLCRGAGVSTGWRLDRGFLFYMGADSRSDTSFQIALIWHESGTDDIVDCASLGDLDEIGKCDVPLNDTWTINYEWMPSTLPGIPDEGGSGEHE